MIKVICLLFATGVIICNSTRYQHIILFTDVRSCITWFIILLRIVGWTLLCEESERHMPIRSTTVAGG